MDAPIARSFHTAVWTDKEMIVWGGESSSDGTLNTGARYDPATDTWAPPIPLVGAPSARFYHTAVWTGAEMIIWGGSAGNTGGRYDPATDTWADTSLVGAPSTVSAVVWTGTEMIVWSGVDSVSRYDPATDTWRTTNTVGAPSARTGHTAVWTGKEMIVWGGNQELTYFNTGARYDPVTNTWVATNTVGAPSARASHRAIWTGKEMIVWGGLYRYGMFPRYVTVYLDTGGRYNPATDTWLATNTVGAPSARVGHMEIWTDAGMIVWGGEDGRGGYLNTGGWYDPEADTWVATNTVGAPSGRAGSTVVWTGTEMIVWGGSYYSGGYTHFNTGGRYDPATDTWKATNTVGAPSARQWHTAVWTGKEMIVWGGDDGGRLNTGGRYCASVNLEGPPPN